MGDITGAADKMITATGSLALGDITSTTGFNFAGTLDVATQTVVLNDADTANLGVSTTLATGGLLTTVNGALLSGGESLTATGSANVDGKFTNDGSVTGPAGVDVLTFTDDVDGSGSYTGNIAFAGGFSPGSSPAVVNFENLTLANTATVTIELGGAIAGSEHDQINASGTIEVDGVLDVLLTGGFTPTAGDTFEIISSSNLLGNFDTVNLPTLPGDLLWFVNQTATTLELVSTFAADFDEDGIVDGNDLAAWKTGFGSAPPTT